MADHKTDDLSLAKRNFLSRRIAAGDQLTQARADHYIKAHEKVLKDFEDSGPYFRAIAKHVDKPWQQTATPETSSRAAQSKSSPGEDAVPTHSDEAIAGDAPLRLQAFQIVGEH